VIRGTLDYTIKIGGEAGQGVQSIGDSLARVFARSGHYVFIHQDYESRIRGGHNFFQIRVSDVPVHCSRQSLDIVIALDKPSVENNQGNLAQGGMIVYDSSILKQKYDGPQFLDIPFIEIATKDGGSGIMANTVATGAVLGMLGMSLDIFNQVVAELFQRKGQQVVNENQQAARRGNEYAVTNCERCGFNMGQGTNRPNLLMDGNTAVAVGAILSGCKFYSAYPMTPSTGVLSFMAAKAAKYGIVVEQAEDEIAAINMAIGASFAGVRAMTGTAGGGFALMVEGLSLAAMTETPMVIFVGQRPAPATGLPTKTEQGDLSFVLNAGHGEFPRVVFAPGSPRQAFYLTNKAFDLAEKYQIQVFILSDQYMADSQWAYDELDMSRILYRDYRLRGKALEETRDYKRFAFTDSGVTPLGIPGQSRNLIVADSDEHDEEGHLTEDAAVRNRMVQKRLLKKLPAIREEISPPQFYGHGDDDCVVISWGSTFGILKEAVEQLSRSRKISLLHFAEISPFPKIQKFDYLQLLKRAKQTICVEQNATSQFAKLLRAETGFSVSSTINKYDGRPFLLETLLGELNARIR
jgi:2-oxoglutarate/2-oxoacid ferredoxin oxidoreductase subunit alpha